MAAKPHTAARALAKAVAEVASLPLRNCRMEAAAAPAGGGKIAVALADAETGYVAYCGVCRDPGGGDGLAEGPAKLVFEGLAEAGLKPAAIETADAGLAAFLSALCAAALPGVEVREGKCEAARAALAKHGMAE